MSSRRHTKYIFVTGGVVSSLGKGILAASAAALLETRGLKVSLTKADPYINVDPGTMNPFQHGEVYVTDDGAETDLDIGHYERFTSARLSKRNSFSAGQVYDSVLTKERRGEYLGGTVQVVPHITEQIKENIFKASEGADISFVEIGGTVGDIEGLPFLEAIRQMRMDLGDDNVLYIHLTLVPYINAAKELKTKPTQHSVKELRQIGIQPNILVCRTGEYDLPDDLRRKIALFCNVKPEHVIEAKDVDSIYKLPTILNGQGLDQVIVDQLKIWTAAPNLSQWKHIVDVLDNPKTSAVIGVVGKYTDVIDAYKSINESLLHAGIEYAAKVEVRYIDAAEINKTNAPSLLESCDGIIVPGGFGGRGIDGKIAAIEYARVKKLPFLGICLGMQVAAIEFARNVLELKDANSQEFAPESSNQVIHLMDEQKDVEDLGGTMRLGAYPCDISPNSVASRCYQRESISERHRHRYEFNNHYREMFEASGMKFSGLSPDKKLVEMIELDQHPFFIACQFHPELKSRPTASHPLFSGLIRASLDRKEKGKST